MIKKVMFVVISFMILILVIIGGYVIYLTTGYYRIQDLREYSIDIVKSNDLVKLNNNYKITTFNIGFGAYNHDFSFFMDKGEMLDGTKKQGVLSTAISKDVVIDNTNGIINEIGKLNPDFMLYQEVDVESTRSHKVNQYEMLDNKFNTYNSLLVNNFHSRFLFYPILNPMGSVDSGIVTSSNKYIEKTIRHKLEIDESFINRFFDLDRCFSASYLPIENSDKMLVLVNVHLSAYDEGGVYRTKQWEQLLNFFNDEVSKGNYIVCGGDFNHDISLDESFVGFPTNQLMPEWIYTLTENDLISKSPNMRFITSTNAPTRRSTDMPYVKGENYCAVIDGFIVSSNVEVKYIENIDLDFLYSDHNPVYMEFVLK